MTEFFTEYGMFLAKTITVVVAFMMLFGTLASFSARNRHISKGRISINFINDDLEDMKEILKGNILTKEDLKKDEKEQKKKAKAEKKADTPQVRKRVYVLDFNGDVRAEGVESLRQEITAILTFATPEDEVVMRLESPGGQVHMYGFAASQLERLKTRNIPLTVCVDKVAASGGYMMACVANRIIAAPFAIVGSIGVVAELPNFNRVLKRLDIDYDVYTAGEFKRTVTMMGENTADGIAKFKEELEDTQVLFKALVHRHRPQLAIDGVATGEHWYGSSALSNALIDELGTSDDYLFDLSKNADIFEIKYEIRRGLAEKLGLHLDAMIKNAVGRALRDASRDARYP
ncbi:Peptidase family S49 [gamma proteobacterium HdN1]|nr:Peptidase family S49 [gamma proteobacterium HdN1]